MPYHIDHPEWRQANGGFTNRDTGFRVSGPPAPRVFVFRPLEGGNPPRDVSLDSPNLIRKPDGQPFVFETHDEAMAFADGYASCAYRLVGEMERFAQFVRPRHVRERQHAVQISTALLERLGQQVQDCPNQFFQHLTDEGSRRGFLRIVSSRTGRVVLSETVLDQIDVVIAAHSDNGHIFDLWEVTAAEFRNMSNILPPRPHRPREYTCRFDRVREQGRRWPSIDLQTEPDLFG